MRRFIWLTILLVLAVSISNAQKTNSPSAASYLERGNAWYARGDLRQALADYERAISLDPNYAAAYFNRANIKKDQGTCERLSLITAKQLKSIPASRRLIATAALFAM